MERVNIVVLAGLAGALALLGLRLFGSSDAPSAPGGAGEVRGLAGGPDGARDRQLPKGRIAMYGGEAGEGRKPTPGGTPGGKKRYSHDGGGADSPEVIAGLERRRDFLSYQRRRAHGDADVEEAVAGMPDLMAGRVGAVPKAPGGRNQNVTENPEPQPEEQPKKNDDSAGVLLRIPFNGSVDAEIGGGAIQSDGLVTDGDQVEFPENAQYSFPLGKNVNSDEGTIAFDINPNWAGSDPTNNSLVQIRDENVWENALSIVKNYSALRFIRCLRPYPVARLGHCIPTGAAAPRRGNSDRRRHVAVRRRRVHGRDADGEPAQLLQTTPVTSAPTFPNLLRRAPRSDSQSSG
jgi:hypothetical protein